MFNSFWYQLFDSLLIDWLIEAIKCSLMHYWGERRCEVWSVKCEVCLEFWTTEEGFRWNESAVIIVVDRSCSVATSWHGGMVNRCSVWGCGVGYSFRLVFFLRGVFLCCSPRENWFHALFFHIICCCLGNGVHTLPHTVNWLEWERKTLLYATVHYAMLPS